MQPTGGGGGLARFRSAPSTSLEAMLASEEEELEEVVVDPLTPKPTATTTPTHQLHKISPNPPENPSAVVDQELYEILSQIDDHLLQHWNNDHYLSLTRDFSGSSKRPRVIDSQHPSLKFPSQLQVNEREEVQKKVTSETVIEDGSNYEISLSLEDLKQHFGKKLDDAVKGLGASRSTVKRACRSHGIKRWPFPKRKKVNHHPLSNPNQADAAAAAQTIQDVTKAQDFGTVKAKYRDTIIKFQLSFSSGIAELVENVTKRLPLTSGSFSMRYKDDEGDLILIACDEDLNDCLVGWLSLPDKKPIRMFIDDESIINQAP